MSVFGRLLLLVLLLNGSLLFAQEEREGKNFEPYPEELLNRLKGGVTLPLRVDNSSQMWFPPVFTQYGWSCNQASSIGYLLTYELNRKRNLNADSLQNQYAPLYVWNMLNSNFSGTGVSYFDSWELIKANGCPNYHDFPYWSNHSVWMNGYDRYYRSMKNKVIKNYSFSVADANGLRALKTYLFNHNDNYRYGGLANFQIASSGMHIKTLPQDSYDAGKYVITRFGDHVGHAMTIVGYNDDVKYDFNGDGLYTNHLDLNGDGEVTLADYEVGALLVVNSWGKEWLDRGRAYVPYRVMARYGYEGGFWNKSVHVIEVLPAYEPQLTMKLELVHTSRNMIRIGAGVASDTAAQKPDVIHQFPLFNFQGGEVSLGSAATGEYMEIGLDLTPLLSYVQTNTPTKFFVLIDESDPAGVGTGTVYNFEIMDYTQNPVSSISTEGHFSLKDNQTTLIHVSKELSFDKLSVAEYPVQYIRSNNWFTMPLQAHGAKGAVSWEIVYDYEEDSTVRDYPEHAGEIIPRTFGGDSYPEMQLPFDFPFYGELYDKIYLDEEGGIFLNTQFQQYPYAVDPDLGFKQRKTITPFAHDLSYFSSDNRMRYHPTDTVVTVFWDAMASVYGTSTNIRFACHLYPSGLIEFHYSDYNLIGKTQAEFSSGLSNGDGKTTRYTTASLMGEIMPNQVVQLIPFNTPPKSKIENGMLFCRPEEENQNFEIKVKVSDNNLQEAFGIIPISTIDLKAAAEEILVYPNPFVDETTIEFVVPEADSPVSFRIFDLSGKLLSSLLEQTMDLGLHRIAWNGRSQQGSILPEGIYLGVLKVADQYQHVKFVKTR